MGGRWVEGREDNHVVRNNDELFISWIINKSRYHNCESNMGVRKRGEVARMNDKLIICLIDKNSKSQRCESIMSREGGRRE